MTNSHSDIEIREARARLWHMGNIEWQFSTTQKEIYKFVNNLKTRTSVLNISRRCGKSYLLTLMAVEQCIRKPKSIVKMLQPEKIMVQTNIRPIMEKIFEDCPSELKPQYKTQGGYYLFPNGSEIQLAGADNGNHEKLRGGDADLCIVDEAGFIKADLGYIVKSVLLPSTLLTKGKIILSSTTPPDANHQFIDYMKHAELKGTLVRKTIYDVMEDNKNDFNKLITEEIIEEIIEEYPGGAASDDFRRECLCEIVTDGDNSVIPEFTPEMQSLIIQERKRPPFATRYVSMDIGFKDLTVVLFAYYDFDTGLTVVEDEIVINGPKMTTDKLANDIKQKELELWTDPVTNEFHKPYLRVSDNNLILINDLIRLHNLLFIPTKKDNREAQINNTRIAISNAQIAINPKCETLIHHLKYASWNKRRTDFTRSSEGGHYDAVAALVYLMRNIDKNKNPYPKGYKINQLQERGDIFRSPYSDNKTSKTNKMIDDIFKVESSLFKKRKN
jgi:hypothetical protein